MGTTAPAVGGDASASPTSLLAPALPQAAKPPVLLVEAGREAVECFLRAVTAGGPGPGPRSLEEDLASLTSVWEHLLAPGSHLPDKRVAGALFPLLPWLLGVLGAHGKHVGIASVGLNLLRWILPASGECEAGRVAAVEALDTHLACEDVVQPSMWVLHLLCWREGERNVNKVWWDGVGADALLRSEGVWGAVRGLGTVGRCARWPSCPQWWLPLRPTAPVTASQRRGLGCLLPLPGCEHMWYGGSKQRGRARDASRNAGFIAPCPLTPSPRTPGTCTLYTTVARSHGTAPETCDRRATFCRPRPPCSPSCSAGIATVTGPSPAFAWSCCTHCAKLGTARYGDALLAGLQPEASVTHAHPVHRSPVLSPISTIAHIVHQQARIAEATEALLLVVLRLFLRSKPPVRGDRGGPEMPHREGTALAADCLLALMPHLSGDPCPALEEATIAATRMAAVKLAKDLRVASAALAVRASTGVVVSVAASSRGSSLLQSLMSMCVATKCACR
jgi:hypothetical protein